MLEGSTGDQAHYSQAPTLAVGPGAATKTIGFMPSARSSALAPATAAGKAAVKPWRRAFAERWGEPWEGARGRRPQSSQCSGSARHPDLPRRMKTSSGLRGRTSRSAPVPQHSSDEFLGPPWTSQRPFTYRSGKERLRVARRDRAPATRSLFGRARGRCCLAAFARVESRWVRQCVEYRHADAHLVRILARMPAGSQLAPLLFAARTKFSLMPPVKD